jgi:hypothetical protein
MIQTESRVWPDSGVKPAVGDEVYTGQERPIAEYDNWAMWAVTKDVDMIAGIINDLELVESVTRLTFDTEANRPSEADLTLADDEGWIYLELDTGRIYSVKDDGAGNPVWFQLGIGKNDVGSTELATDAVGTTHLQTGAVDADAIGDGEVGSAEIAADAVGSSEVATDAIGSAEISTDAVGMSEIDTSISPTWTSSHTFDAGLTANGQITAENSQVKAVDVSAEDGYVRAGGAGLDSTEATNSVYMYRTSGGGASYPFTDAGNMVLEARGNTTVNRSINMFVNDDYLAGFSRGVIDFSKDADPPIRVSHGAGIQDGDGDLVFGPRSWGPNLYYKDGDTAMQISRLSNHVQFRTYENKTFKISDMYGGFVATEYVSGAGRGTMHYYNSDLNLATTNRIYLGGDDNYYIRYESSRDGIRFSLPNGDRIAYFDDRNSTGGGQANMTLYGTLSFSAFPDAADVGTTPAIFVNGNGELKVKFGNGTVKTIATDA